MLVKVLQAQLRLRIEMTMQKFVSSINFEFGSKMRHWFLGDYSRVEAGSRALEEHAKGNPVSDGLF